MPIRVRPGADGWSTNGHGGRGVATSPLDGLRRGLRLALPRHWRGWYCRHAQLNGLNQIVPEPSNRLLWCYWEAVGLGQAPCSPTREKCPEANPLVADQPKIETNNPESRSWLCRCTGSSSSARRAGFCQGDRLAAFFLLAPAAIGDDPE